MERLGFYAVKLLIWGGCAAMLLTVGLDATGYLSHTTGRAIAGTIFCLMLGGVVLVGGALVFSKRFDGEDCDERC